MIQNPLFDGSLWAIAPEAIAQMVSVLPRDGAGVSQPSAMFGDDERYEPDLEVVDGVAIIPIAGIISKRVSFFSFFSGGSNIDRTRADLFAALADSRIRAIVLNVDSPGGNVSGVSELAETVFQARQQKPIVTFSDGQICSAATWIGSAADKKVLSPTAQDGSIGVLLVHMESSKADELAGYKYTYLTAGKYKALGNDGEPLSNEAREMFQSRLDEIYGVFISSMARYRGVSEEAVRQDMADGRVFVGRQAVEAGLADGLGSLRDAIDAAVSLSVARNRTQNQGVVAMRIEDITNVEQLRGAFPQLCQAMETAAADAARAGVDTQTPAAQAAEAERVRVLGLVSVHFGQDAGQKFSAIANGGVTVDQYTAMRAALGAGPAGQTPAAQDEDFRRRMVAGISGASAPDPGAGGGNVSGPATWEAAVAAIQKEKGVTIAAAIRQAVTDHPKLHAAFVEGQGKPRRE